MWLQNDTCCRGNILHNREEITFRYGHMHAYSKSDSMVLLTLSQLSLKEILEILASFVRLSKWDLPAER